MAKGVRLGSGLRRARLVNAQIRTKKKRVLRALMMISGSDDSNVDIQKIFEEYLELEWPGEEVRAQDFIEENREVLEEEEKKEYELDQVRGADQLLGAPDPVSED